MGVTYLLDTHAVVWLTDPGVRTPRKVASALSAASTGVLVSAVSALELATKQRLGKFTSAALDRWHATVRDLRAAELGISTDHALLASRLDWSHRDPFDRLLAAQSIVESVTLVTTDRAFVGTPGVSLLRW